MPHQVRRVSLCWNQRCLSLCQVVADGASLGIVRARPNCAHRWLALLEVLPTLVVRPAPLGMQYGARDGQQAICGGHEPPQAAAG